MIILHMVCLLYNVLAILIQCVILSRKGTNSQGAHCCPSESLGEEDKRRIILTPTPQRHLVPFQLYSNLPSEWVLHHTEANPLGHRRANSLKLNSTGIPWFSWLDPEYRH